MKLTFVLPTNGLNGGIRVIGIIAGRLRDRGHQVHVVCQPFGNPPLKNRLRALRNEGRWLRRPRPGPFLDHLSDCLTTFETPRPVTDADVADADAVVATWWQTAPWVNDLSPDKGAKLYFMQDYGARGQEIEKLIPTWQMPFTFITLTEHLRGLIQTHNPGADVAIIRNAADVALFDAPTPRQRNQSVRVGLAYRTAYTKGIEVGMEALERLRTEIPDLRAVAVSPTQEVLPDWIEQVVRPTDTEFVDIYRNCDLWLFPSRMEGFGLPIVEAMACRTPVVSTRVGGAPDVIKDGVNGFIVPIDDAAAMAEAAARILTGPEADWSAMSDAAYSSARGYTWSDAVDVFEETILRAVERHRA